MPNEFRIIENVNLKVINAFKIIQSPVILLTRLANEHRTRLQTCVY